MNKSEKKFVIVSISVLLLIILIVIIVSLVSRSKRKERFDKFILQIQDYCNKNFGDCWYADGTDHIDVHVWVPGTALAITINPLNKKDVIEKFGKIAQQMNDSAWKNKLDCGVTFWLHNDLNTEKTLYIWINGELWEGV